MWCSFFRGKHDELLDEALQRALRREALRLRRIADDSTSGSGWRCGHRRASALASGRDDQHADDACDEACTGATAADAATAALPSCRDANASPSVCIDVYSHDTAWLHAYEARVRVVVQHTHGSRSGSRTDAHALRDAHARLRRVLHDAHTRVDSDGGGDGGGDVYAVYALCIDAWRAIAAQLCGRDSDECVVAQCNAALCALLCGHDAITPSPSSTLYVVHARDDDDVTADARGAASWSQRTQQQRLALRHASTSRDGVAAYVRWVTAAVALLQPPSPHTRAAATASAASSSSCARVHVADAHLRCALAVQQAVTRRDMAAVMTLVQRAHAVDAAAATAQQPRETTRPQRQHESARDSNDDDDNRHNDDAGDEGGGGDDGAAAALHARAGDGNGGDGGDGGDGRHRCCHRSSNNNNNKRNSDADVTSSSSSVSSVAVCTVLCLCGRALRACVRRARRLRTRLRLLARLTRHASTAAALTTAVAAAQRLQQRARQNATRCAMYYGLTHMVLRLALSSPSSSSDVAAAGRDDSDDDDDDAWLRAMCDARVSDASVARVWTVAFMALCVQRLSRAAALPWCQQPPSSSAHNATFTTAVDDNDNDDAESFAAVVTAASRVCCRAAATLTALSLTRLATCPLRSLAAAYVLRDTHTCATCARWQPLRLTTRAVHLRVRPHRDGDDNNDDDKKDSRGDDDANDGAARRHDRRGTVERGNEATAAATTTTTASAAVLLRTSLSSSSWRVTRCARWGRVCCDGSGVDTTTRAQCTHDAMVARCAAMSLLSCDAAASTLPCAVLSLAQHVTASP